MFRKEKVEADLEITRYIIIPYNRKLLRVKTFTNFTVFEPLAKVFSTKLGVLYPPNTIGFSILQKFSPAKVSGYVVISETLYTKYRDAFKPLQWHTPPRQGLH